MSFPINNVISLITELQAKATTTNHTCDRKTTKKTEVG